MPTNLYSSSSIKVHKKSNVAICCTYVVPKTKNTLQIFHYQRVLNIKVIPEGLEPSTHRLEICCSIQLSYGTDFRLAKVIKILEMQFFSLKY